MGLRFWVRRFLTVATALFFIIGCVHLLKGQSAGESALQGLIWSLIAAIVFTVSRYFQARSGQHCALCNDIPDASSSTAPDSRE
jgi:hypothetical protein